MTTFPATLESLAPITAVALAAANAAGLNEHAAWQVQLAVDEAASNIIQHAYASAKPGTIDLSWVLTKTALVVTLRDQGIQFDPDSVPPPDISATIDERQAGGLGLFLMRRLMDDVRFVSEPSGNVMTLVKYLPNTPPDVAIISLSGRLDAAQTDRIMAAARAAIPSGADRVLLDLSEISFLSSSGLRALLLLRRDLLLRSGELRLCGLISTVHEVFAITGFTQVFAIHATAEEALTAFGAKV